jgi:hypothetical protein
MDEETQFWLEVFKIAATLAAAGVAAWVAYRIGSSQRDIATQQAETASEQKRIAAAKLNLELFEERYALFQTVWKFLTEQLNGLHEQQSPLSPEFTNLIPKARFLFGNEIGDYMDEAFKKRVRLMTLIRQHNRELNNPSVEGQTMGSLEQWFTDEATNCFKRFSPYLDFSAWRA